MLLSALPSPLKTIFKASGVAIGLAYKGTKCVRRRLTSVLRSQKEETGLGDNHTSKSLDLVAPLSCSKDFASRASYRSVEAIQALAFDFLQSSIAILTFLALIDFVEYV